MVYFFDLAVTDDGDGDAENILGKGSPLGDSMSKVREKRSTSKSGIFF